MLKALKWAYDLGVSQERTRIARELEAEYSRRLIQANQLDVMYVDASPSAVKRKERLQFRKAVAHEVGELVDLILKPRTEYISMASIMFPEQEKI